MTRPADGRSRCLAALKKHGLLLAADKTLPSVSTIVAGAPVTGSWWKHPARQEIFDVQEALRDRDDVLSLRLVEGKHTFVARRLWQDVLAVALAGDEARTELLPRREAALLEIVENEGFVRVDDALGARLDAHVANLGKELEARLLALGGQTHTETGAHARTLTSWRRWAKDAGVEPTTRVDAARARIEAAAASLGAGARLPWTPAKGPRGRR